MATIKKSAKKVAAKKVSPMMKAPSMGGSSPMMKMGGKVKKMQKGGSVADTLSTVKSRYITTAKDVANNPRLKKEDVGNIHDMNKFKVRQPSGYIETGYERKSTNPNRPGYGHTEKQIKLSKEKNGGITKKAKSGGSFPDLNKDGKITKADVLKGRGVIAKKGMKIGKCKGGC